MISIIMPVYNGEKYLESTINNVLQTSEEIELIIIDDGSVDNSKEIYNGYVERDKRVRAYQKKNGGIADARNYGLSKAQGEYICFCDQDDFVDKELYKVLRDDMEEHDCDLVISNPGTLREGKMNDSKSIYHSKIEQDIEKLVLEVLSGKLIIDKEENGIIWPSIWNCMFKKKIIEEAHISFHKFVEYEDDGLFLTEYLTKCKRVYLEKRNLYFWREHIESESHVMRYKERYYSRAIKLWQYRKKVVEEHVSKQNYHILEMYSKIDIFIRTLQNMCVSKEDIIEKVRHMKNIGKELLPENLKKEIRKMGISKDITHEYRCLYNTYVRFGTWAVVGRYQRWLSHHRKNEK